VWGRDEQQGSFGGAATAATAAAAAAGLQLSGLRFKQEDIDTIVQRADQRGDDAEMHRMVLGPMTDTFAVALLNLCISDINKQLLLNNEQFLPLLRDLLLLDPAHPARELLQADFDVIAPAVQRVSASSPSSSPPISSTHASS
jgi:hypothetical protein